MNWGLIGTRGYAASAAAPGVKASQNGELLAVLGRDPERTRDFAREHDVEVAATLLDEFLATPGLDAVWVVSPTFMHHPHGMAALKAGKHVLLEKPLATTAGEAWELVEAASRSGVLLATGYQGRCVPGHQAMKRLIEDGSIGDVTAARTYYGVHRDGPPPEWRQHRAEARWGALADIGTHHLDLMRMLLGEVVDAHGLTAHKLGFETEDVAAAALRFESGVLATLTATVNVWKMATRVEVHGTKGALVALDTNPAGAGTVALITADGERDVTGERPSSLWAALVDAIEAAAAGHDAVYATGSDGARNIEILERLG
ncbi:MAG: Gfo/Idh/MocA family oxidoreductase [Actinomycetota bacterium]|nr:Gfo/Idh/MocA family oxidoreductase [Actinomycetota bacterium]